MATASRPDSIDTTAEAETLGACPSCGTRIPTYCHLISYRQRGWPTMFAECDDCGAVVHPR
ncbi:hypothetical protein Hbl1158_15575 (plasmid) [Halobaculum sp. CBA1158]|uniref:DUF7837 family putative zinc-binding protein n=1 Tax=Halobaculum sp. CBA1158 TaxID=2904243 RepID=UPI001F3DB60B|nr:hypothetical protein [Halobaculum sp. CBA1158]UIP01331.1 hypothetical protein Hbl1158_15575 [Halobaculum sp. CBA1158]